MGDEGAGVSVTAVCPVCGGERKNIVLRGEGRKDNENWAMCESCKLFFIRNMPPEEHLYAAYKSGAYRRAVYKDRQNKWGMDTAQTHLYEIVNASLRAQHTLMTIAGLGIHPKRFLDIGSGAGILPWALKREWKGCVVDCVEPFPEYLVFYGHTVFGDIRVFRSLDEVTETYDTITCIHTLEHIPDPIQFLSKIAKHLEPGGKLLVETPNYSPKDHNNPFQRAHVFAYTVEGMGKVLEKAGLVPKTYMTHGWLYGQGTDVSILMVAERRDENRQQDQTKA